MRFPLVLDMNKYVDHPGHAGEGGGGGTGGEGGGRINQRSDFQVTTVQYDLCFFFY